MGKLLSDKEQKKQFKKIASLNPEKYYPTKTLEKNGFHRYQCSKCEKFFWSYKPSDVCGEPTCNAGFQVVKNNPTKNHLSFIGVWKKIVEILEPRGYRPLKRYPVVARWNPTTEFTIASIAAFQPYVISGEIHPPAKKLIIPQFCLRFSDIENVGITGSHCTGFVMIGQHMFVDEDEWDQAQAFQDIFDFLVDGVGLEKSEFKIHEDAWAGGGNYGSCLEFFSRGVELFNQVYMLYQQTPNGSEPLKLKVLDMGLGQERVAWFSQAKPTIYDAIFPLVLERLQAITKVEPDHHLFNRFSQYSAFLNSDEVEDLNDAWQVVADKLEMTSEELRAKILPMTALYSIAEHSRALLFAISDGKLPSNVGGGYNLRVIFRRAMGFIDQFNWEIDLGEVCAWHAEELYELFPEVSENLDEVKRVLDVEKQKFYATKKEADKIVAKLLKKSKITEEKLLELYDSNGINPEIIQSAAKHRGINIEIPDDFYKKVMALHERKTQIHTTHKRIEIPIDGLPATKRLYYDDYKIYENQAKVLQITPINYEFVNEKSENDDEFISKNAWTVVVDQTCAYPTSGGQLHDNGWINTVPFEDVITVGPVIVHILTEPPTFKEGDSVQIKIDKHRRNILTHHHSATHVVNAAARVVLGNHINQAGAKKTLEKAHLDITHFENISDEDQQKIEDKANEIVQQGIPLQHGFIERSEAEQKYGMRVYQGGAVPGKKLRIVEIPNVDVEACGGTHVNNTAEIGRIKIIKSQKIQDGIVRLTFTAGETTNKLLERYKEIKKELAEILETSEDNLITRGLELIKKWKLLRKAKNTGNIDPSALELSEYCSLSDDPLKILSKELECPYEDLLIRFKKFKNEYEQMKINITLFAEVMSDENIKKLINSGQKIGKFTLISAWYEGIDNNMLSNLAKKILKQKSDAVVMIGGRNAHGWNLVAFRDVKSLDVNLKIIFVPLIKKFQGKGGGKPTSIQGFFSNPDFSFEKMVSEVKNQLKKFE
ncbi:MAG: alanine--tRNA ligase [Promethearchaeota archaeon]